MSKGTGKTSSADEASALVLYPEDALVLRSLRTLVKSIVADTLPALVAGRALQSRPWYGLCSDSVRRPTCFESSKARTETLIKTQPCSCKRDSGAISGLTEVAKRGVLPY